MTGDRTDPEREDWQSYKLLGEAGGDRLGAVLQGSIVTSTAAGSDAGSVYLINENDYAAADAAGRHRRRGDRSGPCARSGALLYAYGAAAGMRRGPRSATHSSARRGPTSAAAMPGRSIPIRPMI
ncbi:MAG: hypothetical protein JKP98_26870 [Rhodobacteraceae bacterium]|nr:hypothetical protein [Paracoccaceae bacterium]